MTTFTKKKYFFLDEDTVYKSPAIMPSETKVYLTTFSFIFCLICI